MQKTVLIVEDEYLIALDLQMTLEKAGWRVMGPVASVRDALSALDDALPDVTLLDVNLGIEMATPVAERLRQCGVPFAVASAYDMPERYGGDVLIGIPNVGKPTTPLRLLATLDALTGSENSIV